MQSANCAQTSARTLKWRTSINITGAKAGAPRSNGLRVSTLELRPVPGPVIHVLCRLSAPLFAIAAIKRSVNTRAHVPAPFQGTGTSNLYFLPAMKCVGIVSNISNTRKSVSYDFQTRNAPRFFSQLFEVFRNRIKHSFLCLM